jgi:hypothetical protein
VPIALAYASGAMKIPRIDDWAFARVAADLYFSGHFRLVGWGEMTMIGHELWGLPFIAVFGDSIAVLHWAGAAAAALGLAGTFLLYRRLVSTSLAVVGVATIAVLPAFAVLATTYMTDLTSYAGEMLCLALGVLALRAAGRRSLVLLAASVLAGFWAFSCRELSIAAPCAVVLGYLLRERRAGRPLRLPIALLAGILGAAAALYAWRKGLPGDQATPVVRPGLQALEHSVLVLADSYFAVALGLLPVLLLCARGVVAAIAASRGARAVALALGVAGVLLLALPHYPYHETTTVLDGSVLSRYGTGGPQTTGMGARSPLFPAGLWFAINFVAVAAGAAFAGAMWGALPWRLVRQRRLPSADVTVVVAYALLTAALLAFRAVERGFLIDRYFITLTAACALLAMVALRPCGPRTVGHAIGALVALALLSTLIVLDVNAYDTARWQASRDAVARGVPPSAISAGFEWTGSHHLGVIPDPDKIIGYPDRCTLVTFQPLPRGDHQLLETRTYGPLNRVLTRRLWVYRNPRLCPAKPG